MQILAREFYEHDTESVARNLLGKYLVRGKHIGKIVETEGYLGPEDLAAHARFGETDRNSVLFGPAGFAYVYLIYGLHHCLNVSTKGAGHGVLLRGVEGISGPGRLTRAFEIDRSCNGVDMTVQGPLFIIDGENIPDIKVRKTPRIGVDYAGEWKDKLLRYEII
jgi:DNA-3-methyladenine glycosylase